MIIRSRDGRETVYLNLRNLEGFEYYYQEDPTKINFAFNYGEFQFGDRLRFYHDKTDIDLMMSQIVKNPNTNTSSTKEESELVVMKLDDVRKLGFVDRLLITKVFSKNYIRPELTLEKRDKDITMDEVCYARFVDDTLFVLRMQGFELVKPNNELDTNNQVFLSMFDVFESCMENTVN